MKLLVAMGAGDRTPHRFGAYSEEASPVLGFLFSYHYCRKVDMDELLGPLDPKPPLFADSGAFSAHTLGSEITVNEYADWLKRWGHLFDHHANLDVLTDVKQSAANQRALERKGLAPVPVFHAGEDFKVLRRLADRHDYVALGGIARFKNMPVLVGWFDRCFSVCEGKCGLHGFGMTRWELVQRYPWRSVDSSSIGSSYRYGTVKVYDPYSGKWLSWRIADSRAWGRNGWLVREYGMTPGDFVDEDGTRRTSTRALIRLATRSMRRAIADLPSPGRQVLLAEKPETQLMKDVPAINDANGPRVFIADTSLPTTREQDGSARIDTFIGGPVPRREPVSRARGRSGRVSRRGSGQG